MRWIKATQIIPDGIHKKKYHVKYKGSPEILVFINSTWYWFDNGMVESQKYPVHTESWQVIEFLDESDEWISVDTPPPTNEEFNESDYYLCLLESTEQVVCWYNSKDKAWRVGNFKADSLPLENITYYRSLPQPPKQ